MLSFGNCRVVSPSNRALYITSIGWVYSLTLGAVLVLSQFISTDSLSFQSPWSLCRCLLCRKDVPVLHIESILPTFSHHSPLCSWFEGSWNLSWPFLSYLDFACRPFLIQSLVRALYDRVLPHYIALLSTLCWIMGDALMPSFQWISFHRLQIIYSGIGI